MLRIVVISLLLLSLLPAVWSRAEDDAGAEASYTELLAAMDSGRVEAIRILAGERIEGTWHRDGGSDAEAEEVEGEPFHLTYPLVLMDHLLERAERAGVDVQFEPKPSGRDLGTMLMLATNLLFFGAIVWLILHFRRGPDPIEVDAVGREGRATTFNDVAGNTEAVQELREMVGFISSAGAYAQLGARVPRGALLIGPPGTGKTLLARAVAGEANVPFYALSGASITGFLVGLGAMRVRKIFQKAKKTGGVIFIDELDALGGRRGRNTSHNEDERSLTELLVQMDGFASTEGVLVLAATNRADTLDPALLRPGRFDRHIHVGLPTAKEREEILDLHLRRRGVPLTGPVDLVRLARLTPQASGADLENLVNEATIRAGREGAPGVAWRHFEAARDRLTLGSERRGLRVSGADLRVVAYHEAGHAVAGLVFCPEDGLHKVTILPRGDSLGTAHFAPEGDRHLYTRRYLEGQLRKMLAGRAAEEVIFGSEHVTSGAEGDLVHANRLARRMVSRLGMGATHPLLIEDGESEIGAATRSQMDREMADLLARTYADAAALMRSSRGTLDVLAERLLEEETLDGAAVLGVMRAHGLLAEE
jgi:cell division protease FtsH